MKTLELQGFKEIATMSIEELQKRRYFLANKLEDTFESAIDHTHNKDMDGVKGCVSGAIRTVSEIERISGMLLVLESRQRAVRSGDETLCPVCGSETDFEETGAGPEMTHYYRYCSCGWSSELEPIPLDIEIEE